MAKPVDNKAKERKQKIFLAVGGVLLLGLLAFQLPKLMKGSSAPSTAAATTAAPTAAAGAAPVVETASFAATKEKLGSFTTFKGKDPFVALVSDQVATTAPSAPTVTPPAVTTPPAVSTPGVGPVFGTVDGPATSTPAPARTSPARQLPGAVIKLNGTKIRVALGDSFPKNQPVFRLAGLKSGGVRIALVKGGLADGTSAITVTKRHAVTLVNTADNKRWTILVLSTTKGT
jgi:hypothetical protein